MRPAVDTEIPLAVLVNGSSASASEIVAGSIQDLDRGVIVGQRSFGKGLVQNVRPLSYNTQMKVTIARYFTPSGRCIQAIDYSHRKADGSAGRIADSLINEFKTLNGRTVYDGGGIEPDFAVPPPAMPPVVSALNRQGLIFDFTTRFAQQNDNILDPRAFRVDDKTYDAFVDFVRKRGFDFSTDTDVQIERLAGVLAKQKHKEGMEQEIQKLKEKLEIEKNEDLYRHKTAIIPQLQKSIVNRYYFKQGVLEAAFTSDPVILSAVEILNDQKRYNELLGR